VTRLFDALRKARPGEVPARTLPVPLAPVFASREARAERPILPLPSIPVEAVRRSIVPLRPAAPLPVDVEKEMATLRVRLEAVLTERSPRTVMFLAAQGGEGTSTVVAQFAQALAADSSLRVLLVDVHVRRPAYAANGSPLRGGVGVLLPAGNGRDPAASGPDVMPVPAAVASAGGTAPQVLASILQAVGGGYNWILLDGPPVLESPDAAPLGQAADGLIVVVQAGRTKRPVLTRTVDVLSSTGGSDPPPAP
jgi:Mrp family chromosome partitioning ATPase